MLSYKLKENCISIDSVNPLHDYLISLGIKESDIDSFIKEPKPEDELSYAKLDNIVAVCEQLHNGFEQNKKFFLIVDCDVDGFTSSSIFYRFFKLNYPNANIQWMLHEGKEHGIEYDKIPQDTDIIVVPDAGSAQIEEQHKLSADGKTVIILDHHNADNIDYTIPNVWIVNNQCSANFSNKFLSGAGVVLKTIQAYEAIYGVANTKSAQFYDLAALGIIADMMDLRNLDNNAIVYKGLHNINNKMLLALMEQKSFQLGDHINKIGIAFYIAPTINGVIRAGSMEEKSLLFLGFIEEPTSEYIDSTSRGNSYHETFYKYVARLSANVKGRQDTQKIKCFEFLCKKIEREHLNDNRLIAVVTSKDDLVPTPQNITGLIAMELLKKYNKPVLVLRPKYENGVMLYAGSGRSKPFDGLNSFLQFVRDSEYSEYGEGHAMAFGASIPAANFDAFIKESNERLANVDYSSDFIEVDAIFNRSNINYQMLIDFAQGADIYGTNIPEPKIAIEAVVGSGNITVMGKDKTTVKIVVDNLSCIKFKDKELAEQVTQGAKFNMKMVGRANLNTWLGNVTPQLFIDNIEIEPIKTSSLF